MRYLTHDLQRDLSKKVVLLSGPRQCGKTTLAKSLSSSATYFNWDIRTHKRDIREMAWPRTAPLVILDELHKMPAWKNYLKGLSDESAAKPPIIVIGSARLDTFRRSGDALTGRTFHYRLLPIDVEEAGLFFPDMSPSERLDRLIESGGFPEAFLNVADAERLRNDRLEQVLREDLRDLSRTSALQSIDLLMELLRERVGSTISYSNLAGDIGVAPATIKSWIELLERLFIIFIVRPFARGLARSIRKEPKVFFYDCAAAFEKRADGARLENAVACALLKQCHWLTDRTGTRTQLHYFRDRDGHEVDFVVVRDRRILLCVEVKESDDAPTLGLRYANVKIKPAHSVQVVRNLVRERESGGIRVVPAGEWLAGLRDVFASESL